MGKYVYPPKITIDEVKAYRNAIIYFLKNKSIWMYDVVDPDGNKVLCSYCFMPEFYIKGLGKIQYYDENRNLIDSKYYKK